MLHWGMKSRQRREREKERSCRLIKVMRLLLESQLLRGAGGGLGRVSFSLKLHATPTPSHLPHTFFTGPRKFMARLAIYPGNFCPLLYFFFFFAQVALLSAIVLKSFFSFLSFLTKKLKEKKC